MKNHVKNLILLLFLCIPIYYNTSSSADGQMYSIPATSPSISDSHSGIGSKNAPILFQSSSGGYLKKVWKEPEVRDSFKMLKTSIEDGSIVYRDYNNNIVDASTYNAIQTKIGSRNEVSDTIPALVGSKYTNLIERSITSSYFHYAGFEKQVRANSNNWNFVLNYNRYTGEPYIPDPILGPAAHGGFSTDDIPIDYWNTYDHVSTEDIEKVLAHGDDQLAIKKPHGTRWFNEYEVSSLTDSDAVYIYSFTINALPNNKYTAASITFDYCGAEYLQGWFSLDFTRFDLTIKGVFTYTDGTTSEYTNVVEMVGEAFHQADIWCNPNKIASLASAEVSFTFPYKGNILNRYVDLIIDKVSLNTYTYGDAISQVIYQIDAGLPYNELSSFGGVDLSSVEIQQTFLKQVDFIQINFKAKYPTLANIKLFEIVKPLSSTAKNVDADWVTLLSFSYSSSNIDITETISNTVQIQMILSSLIFIDNQSPNYQVGFRVYSKEFGGDTESEVSIDYLSMSIHLRDYSEGPAISNLNYNRDDPSKITWTFTKQVYQKWGLEPLFIIFENLPLDHTTISSTWSRSEEITANRKSLTMSIFGSLPADAVIITEAPNYLEQVNTFAIKEVMTRWAGMQTRILQIESSTFLKETSIRLNVTCKDLDYLGTDAFLRYNLELSNEMKFTSLLQLCPNTNLRNYSLDINLNQIETLEKGGEYDQFIFYINSNNPDEAGFLYLPASFEIRKNDIQNPTYEWGETYINYTFQTNASSDYSVLVVQYNWEWHPEDYIFETNAKNYTANLTSGMILLSNVSIDFPYIFDNIDRHRTYPNPTFTFYFNNTDLGNPYDIIIDEVSVVPYFYYDEEPAKSRIIFNRTDFEPITIDPNAEISVPVNFNYTQCNQTFQRGVYRLYVEFHEMNSEYNSTYFNTTLLMDGDYHDIGNILNYTTYEGLSGEQVIEGNFTKNPDTNAIACYIMDNEGYGDGAFLTFDQHGSFYGNQESPQVTIISPKHSEAYSTSLIPINSRVYDPDFNTDNASLHLFNEIWDLGWIDYPGAGEYHLMNLNPFDLTTGRIYVEVLARDLTLNYAFATSSFYCESYKDAIVNTTQIQIGSVNAKSTIEKVPCNVFVNFSNYDLFTRRIQLGSDYTDATGLKIQRSPLDVYYPQNQPDLGMSPIGDITYWKFDYATQNDILTFSLNSPIVEWNADGEFSTSTRKVFGARIKRHTNLRTYTNVHIIGDFSSLNLQNIRVYVTEITGGANISITNNCSLKYGYFGRYNEYFRVNFTVPLIIKGTDYAFKVAIVEDVSMEIKNYASGFFIGIMIGAVGAGVIRELIRIMKRQPKPKGRNQILRTYLPAILIGVALGCVAGYFWLSG